MFPLQEVTEMVLFTWRTTMKRISLLIYVVLLRQIKPTAPSHTGQEKSSDSPDEEICGNGQTEYHRKNTAATSGPGFTLFAIAVEELARIGMAVPA